MRQDLPSKLGRKGISADTTLTRGDIRRNGCYVVDTSSGAITLTLPSPAKGVDEWDVRFVNDGDTYNVTLSCTNGFLQDDDSLVVEPKQTLDICCHQDADLDYRWVPVSNFVAELGGLTEAVQDIAGAQWSTEDAVTYTDGTGKNAIDGDKLDVDFTPTYSTPAATPSEADDVDDLAAHLYGIDVVLGTLLDGDISDIDFTPTYYTPDATPAEASDVDDLAAHLYGIDVELGTLQGGNTEWAAWTVADGDTWGTAIPADITYVGRYCYTGPSTVKFVLYFSGSDGDGGTPTSFVLPVTPANNATLTPCVGFQKVNATWTNLEPYIVQNDATEGNRLLLFLNAQACTDSQAYAGMISGEYEV